MSRVRKYACFEEVPSGKIIPEGFLLEFLKRQLSGLTGNYKRMRHPFHNCLWTGVIPNDPEHRLEPVSWECYEQTAYLLDGMYRLSRLIEAPALEAAYKKNLEYVISHPTSTGLLGQNYYQPQSEWPMAVFFRSVMAYVDATGDSAAIEAFHRHYLALDVETLGATSRHPANIEGVLKVYEWTGDTTLLEKAEAAFALFNESAAKKDNPEALHWGNMEPDRKLNLHGVTFCEMIKIPVILYIYTGKKEYLDRAEKCLAKAIHDHEQACGILSSNEQRLSH